MSWLWFILAGLFSGIVAGMGMGGGTLLIPILTILLSVQQQSAQGINLLAFVPTAIVATIIHSKNKLVDFKVAIPIIIGGIVCSVIGAMLAVKLPSSVLRKVFGAFLILVGVWQIIFTIISARDKTKCYISHININVF